MHLSLVIGKIGSGIGVIKQLLKLNQIDDITWLHPDPKLTKNVLRVLPKEYEIKDKRLNTPSLGVKKYLEEEKNTFDLIILNLGYIL